MLRRPIALAVALLAICVAAAPAHAQNGDDDDDTPGDVSGGVYIDPDGMVRMRERDTVTTSRLFRQRLAALQKPDARGLVYVSIPRALAEARKLADAGEPLPDDLRFMHGMTKVRYVFVFPDERDIVIAGPAEPIVAADSHRPLGKTTGRPVLQLDDLIVALRMYGPGWHAKGAQAFGCSIDMPEGAQKAVTEIVIGPRESREDRARQIADAIGPQTVRLFRAPGNTRFGAACVEADYALKRMAIGVDPSPVATVRYAVGQNGAQMTRWWFTASSDKVLAATSDGLAFELIAPTLKLVTSPDANSRGSNPPAELYAERFTAALPQFAAAVPELADLWNLSDLALVAALIRMDKLDQRIGWNVAPYLDGESALKVAQVTIPRTADTVVNYRSNTWAIGGVQIDPRGMADPSRRADSPDAAARSARPPDDRWFKID